MSNYDYDPFDQFIVFLFKLFGIALFCVGVYAIIVYEKEYNKEVIKESIREIKKEDSIHTSDQYWP